MKTLRRSRIFLAVLAVWSWTSVQAAGAGIGVPSINTPATTQKLPGKIIWHDLVTSNVTAAQRFYWNLFGWQYKLYGSGEDTYFGIYHKGKPVGGMVPLDAKQAVENQNQWVSYLSVANVAQATQYVKLNGGKVLLEPMQYSHQGELAVFTDPEGAVFGVINSSSGDPADGHSRLGEWVWADLMVKSPQQAIQFYQGIASYQVSSYPGGKQGNDFYLYTSKVARASVVGIPAGKEGSDILPNWLPYVLVPDVKAIVRKIPGLGGEVLLEPNAKIYDSRLAIIADPTGAALGLIGVSQKKN